MDIWGKFTILSHFIVSARIGDKQTKRSNQKLSKVICKSALAKKIEATKAVKLVHE